MILALALACTPTVVGTVGSDGGPVPGAVVHATSGPPLDAVTDDQGGFRARVEPGPRRLEVTHPAYLPVQVDVDVQGHGEVLLPTVQLVAVPTEPGVHLRVGDGFVRPAPAPMVRRGDAATGWRWCLGEGTPTAVPAGALRVLDNHEADWRVLRVGADGCVYQLQPTPGGFFNEVADRVEARRDTPFAPGRDWLELELTAGDYVIAEWFAGGFVPEGEGWRAGWVRAGSATTTTPG